MLLCRPPQLSHIPSYHTLFGIADDEQVRNAPRETASHGRSWHHHCNDPSTAAHPSPCQSLGPDLSLKCSVALYVQAAELTKLLESTCGHVEKLNVSDRRDLFVPGTVSTDASRESDQPHSCSPLLLCSQDGNPLKLGSWHILWWQPRWYHAEHDGFCHQPISTTEVRPCSAPPRQPRTNAPNRLSLSHSCPPPPRLCAGNPSFGLLQPRPA